MNKIKISDSDKRLLIIFFAIVILACSYFFIFNKGMTKASELEAQNEQDSAKVQQMQQMEASLPQVKENIENMKQTQADIIAKYPSDMTTEKSIESLQDYEDHSSDFHITDITFAMRMPLVGTADTTAADSSADTADETTDGTTDSAADDTSATTDTTADTQSTGDGTDDATTDASADTSGNVAGYYASIGIRYEASYSGLKEMIAYVNEFKDRTTITQFTAAFDDATGKLTGEMTLNMYYITNTGKDYVPPVFDFMPKGVSNIFGKTIERSQEALGDPY